MTRVLLLKPHSRHSILPPLGIGYLATALKRHGYPARILHCSKEGLDIPATVRTIVESGSDVVGVSTCSNDHPWLVELAEQLSDHPDVCLVVGGAHATGLGGRLLDLIPRIDYGVRGEGERAFPRLAGLLGGGSTADDQLAAIPNLIWRDATGAIRENPMELILDLNDLGYPDWEQMPPAEYAAFSPHGGFTRASPVGQIITTRGCPYGCNFCAAGLIHGRRIRRRSPETITDEIDYLIRAQGVREIHIEDDNFTASKEHVFAVCERIRSQGLQVPFALPNGVRLDRLDDEILQELHATGFYSFFLGIESGSQATLKRMNKALDLREVEETIARIRKYDFQIKGYFIIGYPGETREDIWQTIRYARSLDLDRAYFTLFLPLPGTTVFQELEAHHEIDIHTIDWSQFYTKGRTRPPYVPAGMEPEELEELSHIAYRDYYLRPTMMVKIWKDLRVQSPRHLVEIAWNMARLNLSYFL